MATSIPLLSASGNLSKSQRVYTIQAQTDALNEKVPDFARFDDLDEAPCADMNECQPFARMASRALW